MLFLKQPQTYFYCKIKKAGLKNPAFIYNIVVIFTYAYNLILKKMFLVVLSASPGFHLVL